MTTLFSKYDALRQKGRGLAWTLAAFAALAAWPGTGGRAAPTTVRDARGVDVAVQPPAQRIASGALAADEVTVELLRRAGQLDRIVAVSSLADDNAYSNLVPVPSGIKGRVGGELESLLAVKPDLVLLATYNRQQVLSRLSGAGVRAYVIPDFTRLSDITANIHALGRLLQLETQAEALAAEMAAAVAAATPREPRRPPPRLLHWQPGNTVSGGDTLFDDLARQVGAVNVTGHLKGWPPVSPEAVVSLAPDHIVLAGMPEEREAALARLRGTPGWKELAAVRAGRLILIPGRELASVSHHIVKALAALSAALGSPAGSGGQKP